MLEAGSLAVLGAHFERLMARIQERVDYVRHLPLPSPSSPLHSLTPHPFKVNIPNHHLHALAVPLRRIHDHRRRRRDRALPGSVTADRRAGSRVRQSAAYPGYCEKLPRESGGVVEGGG